MDSRQGAWLKHVGTGAVGRMEGQRLANVANVH